MLYHQECLPDFLEIASVNNSSNRCTIGLYQYDTHHLNRKMLRAFHCDTTVNSAQTHSPQIRIIYSFKDALSSRVNFTVCGPSKKKNISEITYSEESRIEIRYQLTITISLNHQHSVDLVQHAGKKRIAGKRQIPCRPNWISTEESASRQSYL